jgi:hypothetical protein
LGRVRSRRHYQKPEAQKKKELRNAQRSLPVGLADVNASPDVNSLSDVDPSPDVNVSPDVDPSRDIDVAGHVSSGHSCVATTDGSPDMRDESAIPAATLPTVARVERHETRACGRETGAEGDRSFPEVVCAELPAAKPCRTDLQRDPVNGERPDAVQGEMPLGGLVLDEARVVNSPILPYVQMVVSLILGKSVGKDQLVAELLQIMRQRSIDNRTSPLYVSRVLDQPPP